MRTFASFRIALPQALLTVELPFILALPRGDRTVIWAYVLTTSPGVLRATELRVTSLPNSFCPHIIFLIANLFPR